MSQKNIAIEDLLRRIRLGMTRGEVVEALGPPDDVGATSRKHRTPSIYRYGEVELHFEPETGGVLVRAYAEVDRRGITLLGL